MTYASKSPADFCTSHSLSRATFHRLVAAGKLEARKIGRRTIVTADAERAWLESLPKAGNGASVRGAA